MSTKAYDTVKLARSSKRPTGLDYIHNLCGDFFELHGDRCYADDGAIVGGVGHFRG
ncbi:MAG TPA: acetyl-CoA carboxylase carboxyl transferase subunit alpha, partial [Candidatus Evtepia faecavium]|nr:acetyl-CoA carboxylase carboxyl transferase subunit alpha [Candidatus Evtepia faecavium]